jgi:N-carbamoyl-L-amino-acid hydrolase
MIQTDQLRINADRLLEDFDIICSIGATDSGGIHRPALSPEDLEARAWFANLVEQEGFALLDDEAGNLSGVWRSDNPHAQTLMIGSHLDTPPNGGSYDGTVGVLAGLEVIRTLRDADLPLPLHIEVMNFTDAQGTWLSLLGSRSLAGQLALEKLKEARGGDATFRAALNRAGITLDKLTQAQRPANSLAAFLELHVEQGDVLEQAQLPIGVVEGIVGRHTSLVTFHGQTGHSGTTAAPKRRDALQGAAVFITEAHRLVAERFPDGTVNVADLSVEPAIFNVIPNRAAALLEWRHPDADQLELMRVALLDLAQQCGKRYRLNTQFTDKEHMPAAVMDATMIALTQQVCDQLALPTRHMLSYAGHDAQPMAALVPSLMIFIPSVGGISLSPNEYSRWEDVVNGANVLLQTTIAVAQRFSAV